MPRNTHGRPTRSAQTVQGFNPLLERSPLAVPGISDLDAAELPTNEFRSLVPILLAPAVRNPLAVVVGASALACRGAGPFCFGHSRPVTLGTEAPPPC